MDEEEPLISLIPKGKANRYYAIDINNGCELFPELDQDRKYRLDIISETDKTEVVKTRSKKDPEWWDVFEWFVGQDEYHEVTTYKTKFAIYVWNPGVGWIYIGEKEAKTGEKQGKRVNKDGSTYYFHNDDSRDDTYHPRGEDDLMNALEERMRDKYANRGNKAKEKENATERMPDEKDVLKEVIKEDPSPFFFKVFAADLDEKDSVESYILLPRSGFIGTGFHSGTTDIELSVNRIYTVKELKNSLVTSGRFKDANGNVLKDTDSVKILEIKPAGQPSRVVDRSKNIYTEILHYTMYTVLGLPVDITSQKEN